VVEGQKVVITEALGGLGDVPDRDGIAPDLGLGKDRPDMHRGSLLRMLSSLPRRAVHASSGGRSQVRLGFQ